ncbi:Ig-like domain-containing protein [Deinococcus ficus]|uniref:Ig-like domain-containing protein n=1 Tax=Deinococcus ficus TaxID=317577 RepID=UPI0003F98297|nr:Ig-like domain-containing protein [Deinococcus ficus]
MKFTAPLAVSTLLMLGLAACTPPAPPTPGPGPGPVGITLTCAAGTVMVGQTLTCTAETVGGQGGALQGQAAFTFTSSAPDRASVSAAGVVTGVSEGTANITASLAGVTSNAVAVSVTPGAPASQPGGTVFIAQGSNTLYTIPMAAGPLREDGTVAYTVVGGGTTVFYVYQDGKSEKVYTVPQSNPQKIAAPGCVDPAGNFVMVGQEKLYYFDRKASSVSPIPFPLVDDDPVLAAVCASDGRIIGSQKDYGSTKDVEVSFEWKPGQPAVTALPPVDSGCIGCSVRAANPAGDVLFYNGLIRGGKVTYFGEGFRAGGLSDTGTVWGVASTTTTDPMFLAAWVNGTVTRHLELPAPEPARRGTQWWVLEANNTGQVLLGRQYEHSGEDGLQRDYFVYRGGTLVPVVPPAGYDDDLAVISLDDQGRVLALTSKENDLFSTALILTTP